jgi:DNA repair protein RadC
VKTRKKSATKKKSITSKHAYLREIKIKFKKKRVKAGSPVGKKITDSAQVVKLFEDLRDEAKETLITISLDVKLKIICFEVVAIGSVASLYFKPGEAVRASVALNAAGIIVLHNHPSGDPTPSPQDKRFTKDLMVVTDALGFEFHDHVIIGHESHFSFADKGLL